MNFTSPERVLSQLYHAAQRFSNIGMGEIGWLLLCHDFIKIEEIPLKIAFFSENSNFWGKKCTPFLEPNVFDIGII